MTGIVNTLHSSPVEKFINDDYYTIVIPDCFAPDFETPIISLERCFQAFSLLIEQGHYPKHVKVPCEIKVGLSAQDTLRIATVENVRRQNLAPLEEAQAIATLVHEGDPLDDIASKTGLIAWYPFYGLVFEVLSFALESFGTRRECRRRSPPWSQSA